MDILKLGRDIRIRWPTGPQIKYCEFVVTYNGLVQEIGNGFYIGLQLKNGSLPAHLQILSRYYRFGGTGIVVPADWVMLNLYKEEENQMEFPDTPHQENYTSNNQSMGKRKICEYFMNIFCARPKTRDGSNENQNDINPNVAFGNTIFNMSSRGPLGERHGCEFCYKEINPECGVVLANCGDSLCHDCISNIIVQQAANNLAAKCPVCQTQIKDDEIYARYTGLDIFLENRIETNCPIKCTNCSENINSETGVDVANCGDLWCRNCISNVIVQQIGDGLEPYCLTCEMPFTDEEIMTYYSEGFIVPDVFHEEDRQNSERNITPPSINKAADECSICFETCQQRVSLVNCNHPFCRECIQKWVAEQQSEENVPNCPVCREPIELE